jgi:3-oxoacyl-[acyl-carrier protein] reductase
MDVKELFSFQDRVILISGASRGIGRALAEGFRDAGAIVYGTGTREESIAWMEGSGIHGRLLDVASPDQAAPLIDEIVKRHGRLHCLINNAGISSITPAAHFTEEEMQRMIETNFKGAMRLCQAYYRAQRRQGGVIINVSSVMGIVATVLASVYCGTKGALIQLTKALAIEWARAGFRVNALCPGFIDTDMTSHIQAREGLMDRMVESIPLRRIGRPEDLVGPAMLLASDAASYMTGQCIVVDGGMTAM